jgi:hypothetical protein
VAKIGAMRVTGEFDTTRVSNKGFLRCVAATASGLAGALGGALYGFVGVSPTLLVAGTAVTGLAIGCHLPPARP